MQSTAPNGSRQRLGEAARYYAVKLGWAVFPLRPRSKTPLISRGHGGRGCFDGTTDERQIREWWRRWPNANIGLALGQRSDGLFALDVDPRNGGDYWLLLEELGPLPDTVNALTGGGGMHILLRGNVACGVLMRGVDVKGEGGYIVLPPSVHPSGALYRWEASSRPGEVEIAVAPGSLLAAVNHNRPGVRRPLEAARTKSGTAALSPCDFVLGAVFEAAGMLGTELKPGVWAARCPNAAHHTCGRDFDSSTVLFAPRRAGGRGAFKCHHSHCGHLR